MKTSREIIHSVRELVDAHSDDSNVTNEFIAYLLDTIRVKYVRQRLGDTRRNVSNSYKQQIEIDLELYKDVLDNTYLRSIDEIPSILDINHIENRSILSSNNVLVKSFNMTNYKRLPYVGSRSHLANMIYGAIGDDNKLYLNSGNSNYKMMNKVKLFAIFDSPEDAWKLSPDYDENIEYWDVPYPIETSLIPDVTKDIVNTLTIPLNIPEDKINDGEDTQS